MSRLKEYIHPRYTKAQQKALFIAYDAYIKTEDYPHLTGFAVEQDIVRDDIYLFPQFVPLIKKGKQKCELFLISKVQSDQLYGKYAFLLKTQHGYRESTPIEITTTTNTLKIELGDRSLGELQEAMLKQGKANKMRNTRKVKSG